MKCPYCNSNVILDVIVGEYVCPSCGTVLGFLYLPSKSMQDYEPLSDYDVFTHRDVKVTCDSRRAQIVGYVRKLEELDNRVRMESLDVRKALRLVYRAASLLNLDSTSLSTAIAFVRSVWERVRKRVVNVNVTYAKLAASAIVYTILTHNLPCSPKDVVKIFQELGHKVSLGDIVELLSSVLGKFSYSTKWRAATYVNYLVSKLELKPEDKMRLLSLSLKLLNRLDNRRVVGKNPRTLAGAIVCVAAKKLGLTASHVDIASLLGISPLTLREHARKVEKMLNIEKITSQAAIS